MVELKYPKKVYKIEYVETDFYLFNLPVNNWLSLSKLKKKAKKQNKSEHFLGNIVTITNL